MTKKSLIIIALLLSSAGARAAIPTTLNYQGRMRNLSGGAPVADSTANSATFRLYTVLTGGSPVWSETQTSVTTTSGLFNVVLGSANPLNVPFDQQYYLEVVWNSITEVMSPRTPLTAGPYAFRAKSLELPFAGTTGTGTIALSVTAGSGAASGAFYGRNNSTNPTAEFINDGLGTPLKVNALSFPTGVGTNGQVLTTNGSNQMSWAPAPAPAAPLSLTATGIPSTLSAFNSFGGAGVYGEASLAGGYGIYGKASVAGAPAIQADGTDIGLSATASNGVAIYGRNNGGGGFKPTALFEAGGTNHGVEGRNTFTGAIGTLAGDLNTGQTGVYGLSTAGFAKAVWGQNANGFGLYGNGMTGVAGVVTTTGQVGVLADSGGFLGSSALRVIGPAQFSAGSVTFTSHIDFSGSTITGWNVPASVSVPLSLTLSSAPFAPLSVSNGAGYGASFVGMSGVAIAAETMALSITSKSSASGTMFVRANTPFGLSQFQNDGGGSAIMAYSGGGNGVFAQSSTVNGVYGQTFGPGWAGINGAAQVAGAYGVKAENYLGGTALYVTGGAKFFGSTTVAAHIDFSGSTVTGWNVPATVVAPLSLSSGSAVSTISAFNTFGGAGVFAQTNLAGGQALYGKATVAGTKAVVVEGFDMGVSITASDLTNGSAIYGRVNSGQPALRGLNDGAGIGVFGSSVAGNGIQGSSTTGSGGQFIGMSGVLASGSLLGVSATANAATGQAFYGRVSSTSAAAEFVNDNVAGTPLKINNMKFPATDLGFGGSMLSTDGAGNLTWTAIGGTLFGGSTGSVPYYTSAVSLGNSGMTWDNTNTRLGLGVATAPLVTLHVGNATTSSAIFNDAAGGGFASFTGRSSQGTLAAPTSSGLGDILASFGARGYGLGLYSTDRAMIRMRAAENWGLSGTFQGTSMGFFTTTNGTNTPLEKMTLDNAGNLGVGTTAPGSTLDVNGAVSFRGMAAPTVAPATQGRIYFDSAAGKFKVSESTGGYVDLVGVSAPLSLSSASSVSALSAFNSNGGYGVYGQASLAGGSGLVGKATVAGTSAVSAQGFDTGLSATASSNSGIAIYGRANSSQPSASLTNDGAGTALSTTAFSTGIYSKVTGTGGAAIYAQSTASSASQALIAVGSYVGVSASTTDTFATGSVGVLGMVNTFMFPGYGVEGRHGSSNGAGVHGFGPTGVLGDSNGGSGSYGVMGSTTGTGGAAVYGNSTGTGPGVLAVGSTLGLSVTGGAFYSSGRSVTFAGHVNFGGPVTGLSVTGPLSLSSSASNVSTLNVYNNSGNSSALYVVGNPAATTPAAEVINNNTNQIAFRATGGGSSGGIGVQGIGAVGVYGLNAGTGTDAVWGMAQTGAGARGVVAQGVAAGVSGSALGANAYGVYASTTQTTGAALRADAPSGTTALRLGGSASIDSATNTITMASYVSFAAGSNLLAVPLVLTGTVAFPGAVLTVSNAGDGLGVIGYATQPGGFAGGGSPTFNSNVSAGLRGYTNVSNSAGVVGLSQITTTAGIGVMGIGMVAVGGYARSDIAGSKGGDFYSGATGGAGVDARADQGVAGSFNGLTGAVITGTGAALIVSGVTSINGIKYPVFDGLAGQVLTTNGAGNLTWTTASSPTGPISLTSVSTISTINAANTGGGVAVLATSSLAGGTGVHGKATVAGARAVLAEGMDIALSATASSATGQVIYASGSTSNSVITGVNGAAGAAVNGNNTASGTGVYGSSTNGNGGYFTSSAPTGLGLVAVMDGLMSSTPGNGAALYATTSHPASYGVYATVSGSGSTGVYGTTSANSGSGVQGVTSGNSSGSVAVDGAAVGTTGIGVFGRNASSFSNPPQSTGVYGVSDRTNGYGVYGVGSGSGGIGVVAQGIGYGVSATATSGGGSAILSSASSTAATEQATNNGTGPAGLFQGGQGDGLRATATGNGTAGTQFGAVKGQYFGGGTAEGFGIWGVASTANPSKMAGVYGEFGSPAMPSFITSGGGAGAGVAGVNGNAGAGIGVYGQALGTGGIAVLASGGAFGVSATANNATTGVAGYFSSVTGLVAAGTAVGLKSNAPVAGLFTGTQSNNYAVQIAHLTSGNALGLLSDMTSPVGGVAIKARNATSTGTAIAIVAEASTTGLTATSSATNGNAVIATAYDVSGVGVNAANAATLGQASYPAGAALFVSGAVKVSTDVFTNQVTASNYSPTVTNSGPAGRVTFTTVATVVNSITVTNSLVTPGSTIIFNYSGMAAPPLTAYVISANTGSFVVRFAAGITFVSGQGFNYMILN